MGSGRKTDVKEDVKKLSNSVAVLKAQAEEEEAKRKAVEAKRVAARAAAVAARDPSLPPLPEYKPYNPTIVHPGIDYGYDAEGSALKQWMQPIKKVVPSAITALEAKKAEAIEDQKSNEEKKAAAIASRPNNEMVLLRATNKEAAANTALSLLTRAQAAGAEDTPEITEAREYLSTCQQELKVATDAAAATTTAEQKAEAATTAAKKKVTDLDASIKRISGFEQEIRNMQNSWMDGKPIELKVMRDKVDELKAELSKPELANVPEIAEAKEQCKNFEKVLNDEVSRLRTKARKQEDTHATFEMQKQINDRVVFSDKLERAEVKKWEGKCLFVRCTQAELTQVENKLGTGSNPKRAYVIVGDEAKQETLELYYIDKATGERVKACEADSPDMHALLRELKAGDDASFLNRKFHKAVGDNQLKTPNHLGERKVELTSHQEDHIRKIVHYARLPEHVTDEKLADWKKIPAVDPGEGDWKEALAIAIRTASDAKAALVEVAEEKERREQEERDLGADTARNNALERLRKKQLAEGVCEYDSKGWNFKVSSKKDEKSGRLYFSVAIGEGIFTSSKTKSLAMKRMIETCHFADPFRAVVLGPQNSHYLDSPGVSARVVENLECAIVEAEKLASKGIYIGIRLNEDAQKAINTQVAAGNDKHLILRAQKLEELWQKNVIDARVKKTAAATVKESDLATVLKTTPFPQGGLGFGDELPLAFRIKGADPQDQKDRMEELKKEVGKMEGAFSQLTSQDAQIKRQLVEVEAEMKKPEVRADADKYAEQQEKKASLEGALATVNQSLNEKQKEIRNCLGWMYSDAMMESLGLDRDMVIALQNIREGKVEGPLPPLSDITTAYVDLEKRMLAISQDANVMQAEVKRIADERAAALAAAGFVPPPPPPPPPPPLELEEEAAEEKEEEEEKVEAAVPVPAAAEVEALSEDDSEEEEEEEEHEEEAQPGDGEEQPRPPGHRMS